MRTFKREQFLPIKLHEAWSFVSNPHNLARITPESLDFRIISKVPDRMYDGLTIEYKVRPLLGIAVTWVSLIKDIQEPYRFTDQQLKGPYHYWNHTHILKEVKGGVMMEDIIEYAPPMDKLIPFLNACVVAPQLQKIFDYRTKKLNEFFGSGHPQK